MPQNERIYRAVTSTPMGKFEVAVLSFEADVTADIRTALQSMWGVHVAQIKVTDIRLSNRRLVAGKQFQPVKNCTSGGEPWAWLGPRVYTGKKPWDKDRA